MTDKPLDSVVCVSCLIDNDFGEFLAAFFAEASLPVEYAIERRNVSKATLTQVASPDILKYNDITRLHKV